MLIISIFLRLRPVTRPNSNIHTCTSSSINSKCSLGFAGTKTDSDKAGLPVTECKMKLSCENIQKHDKNTEYPAGTACPLAFFMKLMYSCITFSFKRVLVQMVHQTICPKTSGLPGEDGTSLDIYNRLSSARSGLLHRQPCLSASWVVFCTGIFTLLVLSKVWTPLVALEACV